MKPLAARLAEIKAMMKQGRFSSARDIASDALAAFPNSAKLLALLAELNAKGATR